MSYDFLQIKEDSKWKCLKLQTFLKRHLLYVGYLKDTFSKFYFRVRKATSLDFYYQSSQSFCHYHLRHKLYQKVSSFQGDRGERGPTGNDGMNGLKVGVKISYRLNFKTTKRANNKTYSWKQQQVWLWCNISFWILYLGSQRRAGLSWQRWNKWNKGRSMIFPKKPHFEFLRFFMNI